MKWFVAVLFALVLLLNYRIWLSPDGMSEVLRLKEAVAVQRAENERLKLRNQQLAAEVRDLKQGFGALEEQARSELGMIAGNETYYQVVPAAGPTSLRLQAGGRGCRRPHRVALSACDSASATGSSCRPPAAAAGLAAPFQSNTRRWPDAP